MASGTVSGPSPQTPQTCIFTGPNANPSAPGSKTPQKCMSEGLFVRLPVSHVARFGRGRGQIYWAKTPQLLHIPAFLWGFSSLWRPFLRQTPDVGLKWQRAPGQVNKHSAPSFPRPPAPPPPTAGAHRNSEEAFIDRFARSQLRPTLPNPRHQQWTTSSAGVGISMGCKERGQ